LKNSTPPGALNDLLPPLRRRGVEFTKIYDVEGISNGDATTLSAAGLFSDIPLAHSGEERRRKDKSMGNNNRKERRTAVYCRAASGHPDDRAGINAQERRLLGYAAENGHAEPIVYCDSGESGLTLDRPAMNALTADIRAGAIGTVIAADRARLARNYPLFAKWRDMLNEHSVELILVNEALRAAHTDGLQYARAGDYLLPLLTLSDPPGAPPLGCYGMRHKAFLKEHKPALYAQLLLSERLYPLCREVDDAAATWFAAIGDPEIAREAILAELVYN
jgi:predicted site-specific integrase-resolvase